MRFGREPSPEEIRDLMWRRVGLFRSRDGLADAVSALDAAAAAKPHDAATRNLVVVAKLIASAALRREESRGGHFRADFPKRDDIHWKVHLVDQHA